MYSSFCHLICSLYSRNFHVWTKYGCFHYESMNHPIHMKITFTATFSVADGCSPVTQLGKNYTHCDGQRPSMGS